MAWWHRGSLGIEIRQRFCAPARAGRLRTVHSGCHCERSTSYGSSGGRAVSIVQRRRCARDRCALGVVESCAVQRFTAKMSYRRDKLPGTRGRGRCRCGYRASLIAERCRARRFILKLFLERKSLNVGRKVGVFQCLAGRDSGLRVVFEHFLPGEVSEPKLQ